jgi:DnaJ-class molecular chaperone
VASDSSDNGVSAGSDDQDRASHEPRECMACRGSGQVISNLGGAPSAVACPWCEGRGVRTPGVDAQAHWAAADGTEPAAEPAS